MKKLFFLILLITALYLCGEKILILDNLNAPRMLSVYGDRAYILQETTVFVYSLSQRKLLFQFCRSGEGPGEILHRPFREPMLFVTKDFVFLDGYSKWIQFTHDGKLIKEKKKDYLNFVILPIADRFVTLQRFVTDMKKPFFKVALCNENFTVMKDLLTQPTPVRGRTIDLFPDSANFWVNNGKIIVEKSGQGMAFSIFDCQGECLETVNIDCRKHPVTQKDFDRAYEQIRHDPETRASGGIPKQFEFTSPEYFPQIREITADDQNVYLLTFNEKPNKTEFVIWNMARRKAVHVYLPSPPVGLFDDELTGRINRYYDFHRGFYYYLRDNEEEEIWELSRIEFLKKN